MKVVVLLLVLLGCDARSRKSWIGIPLSDLDRSPPCGEWDKRKAICIGSDQSSE